MKMWDEVSDPNSVEALTRRHTEEWVRELFRGPHPSHGWTVRRIRHELAEMNEQAEREGKPRREHYYASPKFINELLLVLEGEGVVDCQTSGEDIVEYAFPATQEREA